MDRAAVQQWIEGYESAWRTPGTAAVRELFADAAEYYVSPWATPITGHAAIADFWEAGRDGPDEPFTMTAELIAVDGDTAVARVVVEYLRDTPASWRDLWVLRFDPSGRCVRFEEWPFAPDQPDGQDHPPPPSTPK
ncbi:nuclear transport factor 2 family protein [Nocardia otitidiscaviarum]|uniref:YybH family protein n=1 Tax=Nocardia otitidiscaviarum TaxID=1823 RepID=UPI001894B5BF|nr:nuclear transport factor 2 family protein [Nocardia otitidiscaviarum]MBF6241765.1 nuclear transport factor 2 family protein [Nocardia otitidiscaviarum]